MAVSFSANAKAEICRSLPQKKCCAVAQCFGVLLYCNSFSSDIIKITTESREFSALLPKLFKKAFGVQFDVMPPEDAAGKRTFQITDPEKLQTVLQAYGFDKDTLSLHINLPVVEEDCCKGAFLRGAFLAGGSVTDPDKGYHLELSTTHHSVARESCALVQEVMPFIAKTAARGGGMVLYLKQIEQIADFLTYLGAPVAAMAIMEARLEKELNNKVNRRCNCDDANTSKVVEAVKMQQAAIARENNPEASLTELAAMMEPPITKPAMNNRLKKLMLTAKEK